MHPENVKNVLWDQQPHYPPLVQSDFFERTDVNLIMTESMATRDFLNDLHRQRAVQRGVNHINALMLREATPISCFRTISAHVGFFCPETQSLITTVKRFYDGLYRRHLPGGKALPRDHSLTDTIFRELAEEFTFTGRPAAYATKSRVAFVNGHLEVALLLIGDLPNLESLSELEPVHVVQVPLSDDLPISRAVETLFRIPRKEWIL